MVNNGVGGQIFSEVIIEDEDENWNDNPNGGNQVFQSHNTFQSYNNPYAQVAGNNIPSIKKSQNFDNIQPLIVNQNISKDSSISPSLK